MATIPNYYFNSPYIADAARNLASALAPPDPEKQLAARQAQWQFDRMQELAKIDDENRANAKVVSGDYAKMLSPVIDPTTGKVDQDATNNAVLSAWSDAVAHNADPSVGGKLAGTVNPQFAVSEALAAMKAQEYVNQLRLKAGFEDTRQQREFDYRTGDREDRQQHDIDMQERKAREQAAANAARYEARMKEIRAKQGPGGGGKPPRAVPKPILLELTYGLDDRIKRANRMMPSEKYFKLLENSEKRWQASGSVDEALNWAWAKSFPNSTTYEDAEHEPDIPGGFLSSGSRGMLNPVFPEVDPALDYGDVVTKTQPPAAAPAPAAAPPAAAPIPPRVPRGVSAPPAGKNRKPIGTFGR